MIKKKVCLVGAFAVGKTSLVQRYVYSIFSEKYHTTVGVKVDKKQVNVQGQNIDMIIWDLHGEDDFQSVRMSYLRGASGCIYVADGTRPATLDVALDLRRRAEEAIGRTPSILAINKCDLKSQWEIDIQKIEQWDPQGLTVIHTSAKTGESVEQAFHQLAGKILEDEL
ncbi:MAG: Rab family GTPase [Desulfobacteraceae bacterium]|jgi:small GTP-binding protein